MASDLLAVFATDVGAEGAVTPVGGRTQWEIGGPPAPGGRAVYAPGGIVAHEPEEMIVRVRAGTTVAELDAALSERGQMVALDPADPDRATVGGVLSVGRSGHRAMRYGPMRDTVLEIRYVADTGRMVKAGGPVVKNVSGFDLCRLFVGSLGTLGIIAEVVLRCRPRPQSARWLRGTVRGAEARARVFRPSTVIEDAGRGCWVLLEGHPGDLEAEVESLGRGFVDVAPPPPEVLIRSRRSPSGAVDRPDLHRRVKELFDPTGRLNPGRDPLATAS
jgi:glycolate oxidase FAD binding subunit